MRAMWLILAVLTACSGGSPSETPEAAPPEAAPPEAAPAEDAKVTLAAYSFTLRQGTDPDLDNQVTTTLVVAGPGGQSWDVGPFYGDCAPQDSKAAYALRCTNAGVVSLVEVRSAGGKAEVWKQDQDPGVGKDLPFEKVWGQPG